jgi:hypothetical protein
MLFITPLAGAAPTRKAAALPKVPFGFVLGQTTLEDARGAWNASDSKILAQGYAAFGAGSGVDFLGNSRNDKQYMVDIANADFEGTYNTRFSFFDHVLYSLTIKFTSLLQKEPPQDKKYAIEDVKFIETALRAEYGPPSHSERDLMAGKSPNILAWDFSSNRLLLYYGIDAQLSYFNINLAKAADQYRKKLLNDQLRDNMKKRPLPAKG